MVYDGWGGGEEVQVLCVSVQVVVMGGFRAFVMLPACRALQMYAVKD